MSNKKMDNKQIEELFNEIFSGLALFYRDTNLPDNLISKYKISQILQERGFTDMSYKGGGLTSNLRYLIASANGKDLSPFNANSTDFGHILLNPNAYFKVLDIYEIGNKTQIFLLEIPERAITFFGNVVSNIEEEIVKKARENFEAKVNCEPISHLQSQEWKERTQSPIGISDKGEFFYSPDK